jgi:tetratricopeptide (TPR) repeat protein
MQRLGAGLAILCALATSGLAQQDKIVTKDGKERTAKVVSEDFDGLKLSVEGGTITTPWREVDSVRFANAAKYNEAIEKFLTGAPSEALPLLEALVADDKLRPVLRHNALYYVAVAQQRAGNDDAAIASLELLLKEFPRSRWIIPAGTNLLSLYVAKGDPGSAGKTLDAALAAARAGGSGQVPGFDFLRARLLEEQKKYPDAERMFESVAGAAGGDPELALAAKVALGRCAQKAGRANDAQRRYRELVATDAPNDVLAGAWNGLGELALAEGSAKRSGDDLRYALFAFLRGVVLYAPGRGEASDEYERALAGAARAFKAVGELESDAARKRVFLARAQERREQLAAEFPRSRYLQGL